MKQLQLGDRLEVVNIAGVKVVGIYTRLYDGVLGRVRLADGTDWPFACDAKVKLTTSPLTNCPSHCLTAADYKNFYHAEKIKNTKNTGKDDIAMPSKYQKVRIDLRGKPELQKQIHQQIREMLDEGKTITEIQRIIGCTIATIARVRDERKHFSAPAPEEQATLKKIPETGINDSKFPKNDRLKKLQTMFQIFCELANVNYNEIKDALTQLLQKEAAK